MFTKFIAVTVFIVAAVLILAVGNESARAGAQLASGEFVTLNNHATKGAVEVLEHDGHTIIKLTEDFATQNGPDLKVLIHKEAWPSSYDKNDYVVIGDLKNTHGSQTYEVPKGVALDQYASVVVWCEKFKVAFGSAHLENSTDKAGMMKGEKDAMMKY